MANPNEKIDARNIASVWPQFPVGVAKRRMELRVRSMGRFGGRIEVVEPFGANSAQLFEVEFSPDDLQWHLIDDIGEVAERICGSPVFEGTLTEVMLEIGRLVTRLNEINAAPLQPGNTDLAHEIVYDTKRALEQLVNQREEK